MSRFSLFIFIFICVLSPAVVPAIIDDGELMRNRGDANNDQSVNISDVLYLSNYLFNGGDAPPCMNQADVNDDGVVNGSDPIYLSNWLFSSGSPPPDPGPYNLYCDVDPTSPHLGCDEYICP